MLAYDRDHIEDDYGGLGQVRLDDRAWDPRRAQRSLIVRAFVETAKELIPRSLNASV